METIKVANNVGVIQDAQNTRFIKCGLSKVRVDV